MKKEKKQTERTDHTNIHTALRAIRHKKYGQKDGADEERSSFLFCFTLNLLLISIEHTIHRLWPAASNGSETEMKSPKIIPSHILLSVHISIPAFILYPLRFFFVFCVDSTFYFVVSFKRLPFFVCAVARLRCDYPDVDCFFALFLSGVFLTSGLLHHFFSFLIQLLFLLGKWRKRHPEKCRKLTWNQISFV